MGSEANKITELLSRLKKGKQSDMNELYQAVYPKLKQMAKARMKMERSDHTLQPTALLHEAYIKLCREHDLDWKDRKHFYAIAAKIMREVVIDYARQRRANKRGGKEAVKIELNEQMMGFSSKDPDLIALDDALKVLEAVNPRRAQIVELRYFAGMELEEVAQMLDISVSTIKRDWTAAKLWLYRELKK
ncbi:MAG: sigma-70 family RNA polymerase sigma factor [Deltaproteobacteria bacterium]|nr:sigma-70 family RNA polymerase sigma factor [Deltaproteobacteria bacterium]